MCWEKISTINPVERPLSSPVKAYLVYTGFIIQAQTGNDRAMIRRTHHVQLINYCSFVLELKR